MANWMQRLEARWMRRYAGPVAELPADSGRKAVTVITGGSEGIGRALANEFAAKGHHLMLIARSETYLQTASAEIGRDYGVEVHTAAIDLSSHDAVARVEAALDAAGLYPDYLVNNAGFGLNGHFTDHEPVRIAQLLEVNMGTLTGLIRRYLPDMLARARGGILNIASVGGLFPGPYTAAYYASKAYVVSLTESLAYENAGRGVRISAALPGPVATRFHEKMGATNGIYLQLQTVPSAATVARLTYSGFMGRRTLITPGFLTTFNAIAVRFIPHFLLVPFIGWFLRQRH